MNSGAMLLRLVKIVCLTVWLSVIALPLLALALGAVVSTPPEFGSSILASLVRTCVLALLIATAAVVLGWLPGKLLGTTETHRALLLLVLLLPLALPRYVLYYAWTLLLSPATPLGAVLARQPALARFVGTATSTGVLIGWYWPLAALVLAQGWRSVDGRIWAGASLDATRLQLWRHVTLPLLSRAILLAFGSCFVLSLSEFATFHLAGVKTVGTELAVLHELTGAAAPVARAAWPIALVAILMATALTRASRAWTATTLSVRPARMSGRAWATGVLSVLLAVSWAAPVALLIAHVSTLEPFRQFLALHLDDLGWSFLTAGVAALLAYLIALCGLFYTADGSGSRRTSGLLHKGMSLAIPITLFLAMFLPASLLAVSLLKLLGMSALSAGLRQSWLAVSAGQASRFAGLALILLLLTRYTDQRRLTQMAALDGASCLQRWWHIHVPRVWPMLLGTFLLVTMFSFTELSATMVLLPAGVPNFAQRLLNQMHYARDQQVIASCLILVSLSAVLAAGIIALLRAGRARYVTAVLLVSAILLVVGGCGDDRADGEPRVIHAFGRTGAGPGEFLYPRAITLDVDGSVLVVDKTGRIQRFAQDGKCLETVQMPLIEAGKPTGVSLHEDGRLFVADTHYHRVAIFSRDGELIDEFGRYGQEDGCFIYPTDVAFARDGRIFVSEYGGNDRINVFTSDGAFLFSFGSPGAGDGQLARPSALCVDPARERLYVADACNHRIAVYDLEGELGGYIGSIGRTPGRLRYPYDLTLLADGTIVVCEFGNNRLQLFSPDGQSLAVYGAAGRQLGRLAYPWGVTADARRRAYVVDSGNNRIQVWQL